MNITTTEDRKCVMDFFLGVGDAATTHANLLRVLKRCASDEELRTLSLIDKGESSHALLAKDA